MELFTPNKLLSTELKWYIILFLIVFDVLFDRLVLVGHCYFVSLIMGFIFHFSAANGTTGIVGYMNIYICDSYGGDLFYVFVNLFLLF